MKRGELKQIYSLLTNDEKKHWADAAKYTSYQGLYRYINTNQDEEAYERVLDGLIATIGRERLDKILSNLKNNNDDYKLRKNNEELSIDNITDFKRDIINTIFNCNDVELIEAFKKDFEDIIFACENQLTRLNLQNNI